MPRIDLDSVNQRLKKFKGTILFDREETVSMVAELLAAREVVMYARSAFHNHSCSIWRSDYCNYEVKFIQNACKKYDEVVNAKA